MNLYKYRSGNRRDIKSLANNQFYSAPIESLNDILEAKVTVANSEFKQLDILLTKSTSTTKNSFSGILDNFRQETKKYGIYSLSQTYKDELLWAYYANAHKGFCIEYDFDILKKYQLDGEYFCEVAYQDTLPIIKVDDMQNPKKLIQKLVGTKSNKWKHEKEVRFITGTNGIFHYYNKSVKAIYFGYHSSPKTIKLIMRILRGRGIKYYKIHPQKDLYAFSKGTLPDIYEGYILTNKNNIKKYIPDYDENIEPHRLLIEKAIDIFMQEKVSGEILDVYISSEKGTKKNPIFYIIYKDTIRNLPINRYFISKEEIQQYA